MWRPRILACVAATVAAAACDRPPAPTEAPSPPPPPQRQALVDARLENARRELDRDFVVFAAEQIVIDRLEAPFAAPVTVGSRPGPRTMTSGDSSVVSVEPDGTLVAHRNGAVRVTASGSASSLMVIVRARGRVERVRHASSP